VTKPQNCRYTLLCTSH